MPGRDYLDVVTIGGVSIYNVLVDPNGVLSAARGSLAIESDVGNEKVWQNTDGASTWVQLGTGSGSTTPLSRTMFVDATTTVAPASQDGSIGAPYDSLQDAIDAIVIAGGVEWSIWVGPGNYAGAVSVPSNLQLQIVGASVALTNVPVIVQWSTTNSSVLRFATINVLAVQVTDDGAPSPDAALAFEGCSGCGLVYTPGSTSVVNVTVLDSAVGATIQAQGTLEMTEVDVATTVDLSCTTGTFAEVSFGGDLTFSGTEASFDTCTWPAGKFGVPPSIIFSGAAGTVSIDPWSKQSFLAVAGAVVNGAYATVQWAGPVTVTTGLFDLSNAATSLRLPQAAAPVPTTEGLVYWDTSDDWLVVGDGATTKIFVPANPTGQVQGSIWYHDGTEWVVLTPGAAGEVLTSGGPGADPSWSTAGAMRVIRVEVNGAGGAGTTDSVTQIPTGAHVYDAWVQVTNPFDGAATIDVGTTATADAFFPDTLVDETVADTYTNPQDTTLGAGSVVRVTLGGAPTVGDAVVTVFYATPNA